MHVQRERKSRAQGTRILEPKRRNSKNLRTSLKSRTKNQRKRARTQTTRARTKRMKMKRMKTKTRKRRSVVWLSFAVTPDHGKIGEHVPAWAW